MISNKSWGRWDLDLDLDLEGQRLKGRSVEQNVKMVIISYDEIWNIKKNYKKHNCTNYFTKTSKHQGLDNPAKSLHDYLK